MHLLLIKHERAHTPTPHTPSIFTHYTRTHAHTLDSTTMLPMITAITQSTPAVFGSVYEHGFRARLLLNKAYCEHRPHVGAPTLPSDSASSQRLVVALGGQRGAWAAAALLQKAPDLVPCEMHQVNYPPMATHVSNVDDKRDGP